LIYDLNKIEQNNLEELKSQQETFSDYSPSLSKTLRISPSRNTISIKDGFDSPQRYVKFKRYLDSPSSSSEYNENDSDI